MVTEEQIKTYCEQKQQESELNKSNKKLADEIKQSLIADNKTVIESGRYSVNIEKRVTEDVDEDKMIEVLSDFWNKLHSGEECPFIRTRTIEFVDMEELEKFMYQNNLPEDVILALDNCRIKKESVAIKYKIAKENDNGKKND